MVLTSEFAPNDIYTQIERTGIQGRNLTFSDDLSPGELENMLITAEMLEPLWRSGLELLRHRIL